jgi:HPt (histidine-containing phosphotransfer) domain-containing protein
MSLSKHDLDAFIAAERAALRAGLPAKVDAMESLWGDGQAASLATLERQAHSLYGSTGTFGFQDVSAACKALELAVQAFGQAPSEDGRRSVEDALAQVRGACAQLAAS